MATQRRRPRAYSSPACSLHEFRPASTVTRRRDIRIKRVYDTPDPADGFRALVDRLWPRGISKQRAALDDWLVELAPSAALQALRQRAAQQRVTLLYAAHDMRRNHAVVLREVLRRA